MAETRGKCDRDSQEGAVRLVLFNPLTQPEIERIADLTFNALRTRLAERRMTLDVTRTGRFIPGAGIRSGQRCPAGDACSRRTAQAAQAGVNT